MDEQFRKLMKEWDEVFPGEWVPNRRVYWNKVYREEVQGVNEQKIQRPKIKVTAWIKDGNTYKPMKKNNE